MREEPMLRALFVKRIVPFTMSSWASAGRHRVRNRPASCSSTVPAMLASAAVVGFRSGGVGPTSLWRTWCRATMCRCTASTREPAVTVVEVGTDVGG